MDDGAKLLLAQRSKNVADPIAQAEWAQKKLVWVPNEEKGFVSASVVEEKGDKTVVRLVDSNKELTLNSDDVQRMNPPKFDKVEDMAELACLNEPSVLYNLTQRYYSNMIYTYSSLFCCVINPYQRLPIYSENVMQLYRGKKRHELPPHVYAIADTAYHSMLYDRENQSILCTGESGAGKTENTKRVIQYLVYVGCKNAGAAVASDLSNKLEQQLLRANPILEAFGNAKTIKNDNSSRFGKFIQINFDTSGFISSTSITTYILEKNRVSHQHKNERNFHIFYQMFKGVDSKLKEEIFYTDISKFKFLTNGLLDVTSINDSQEFKDLLTSMEVMEFSKDEVQSIFRALSGIIHHGNLEFVKDRSSDQALLSTEEVLNKISRIFKVNQTHYSQAILSPTVKVGKELTKRTQTPAQAEFSVEAVAKATYERIFKFVVSKINKCLEKDRRSTSSYIGILDIAGFEIFQINSFEQLCINYTNEKLQQLFNHTMFILEQEEYKREGIEWTFIDFGLDLQPCIDLLEKTVGIFNLLDEQCLFPQATDLTFVEKLKEQLNGVPKFQKSDFQNDAKFTIIHYAGKVNYDCKGWLSKNMDPLNDNIIKVLSESSDQFISDLWKGVDDFVGLKDSQPVESKFGAKVKRGLLRTVGGLYKEQLSSLMNTLRATNANFVRCIIPNYEKKPNKIDPSLVLDQLRCNGVLEGIRICRQGYPNRVLFHEFKTRYIILTPKILPPNFMDSRKACEMMLEKMEMDKANYRIGQSKVFFKSGVLANLEEQRDKMLHKYMVIFQALLRSKLGRIAHNKRVQKKPAITIIQRNIRIWLALKEWPWWRLFTRLKPLLSLSMDENKLKQKEDELKRTKEKMDKAEQEIKDLETRLSELQEERARFLSKMQTDSDNIQDLEEKFDLLAKKKAEMEDVIGDLEAQLIDEEKKYRAAKDEIKRIETSLRDLEQSKATLENENQKYQLDRVQLDSKIASLEQDLLSTNDTVAKLTREKKVLEDRMNETCSKLSSEEEKVKNLAKLKSKNEGNLQELMDRIEQLEKIKSDLEKEKSKLEQQINNLRNQNVEFEQSIANLNTQLAKKDSEIISLINKSEEEASKRSELERSVRELTTTCEELKEELETITAAKNKAEKNSKDLSAELASLRNELTESLDTTAIQKDNHMKREQELLTLKKTIEEEAEKHDKILVETKAKHNAVIQDLNDQLENLKKAKTSVDKTKLQLEKDKTDLEDELSRISIAKSENDKKLKTLENAIVDLNNKNKMNEEEKIKNQSAYQKLKKEYDQLLANYEQLESRSTSNDSALNQTKLKISDLSDEIAQLTSDKNNLNAKLIDLQKKLQTEQEKADDEQTNSESLKNKLNEVQKNYDTTRTKLEAAMAEIEEMESAKKSALKDVETAAVRYQELESRFSKLEKSKKKLQEEVDDLSLSLDKERQNCGNLEKKQKKFDQMLAEEKTNSERNRIEKENFEKNLRQSEAKIMTLNKQIEELSQSLSDADQAKKYAQNELAGLLENKDDQGKSLHELERQKRQLEAQLNELREENDQLADELRCAEDAKTRAEVNLQATKTSLENEINSKEEALEDLKRSLTRQIKDLEGVLEEERKNKSSASSSKKRLENEIFSLQEALNEANRAKDESLKQMKKISSQIKEFQREIEEARSNRDEMEKALRQNEYKSKSLESEIVRLREDFSLLEKQKRNVEADKEELQEQLDRLKLNQVSSEEQRRLNAIIAQLNEDLEDEKSEKDEITDRLRKLQSQYDRTNSELANEKLNVENLESSKTSLDRQNRDLKNTIRELEEKVKALSKNTMLESKISMLQETVDTLTNEKASMARSLKKIENKLKEAEYQNSMVRKELEISQDATNKSNVRNRALRDQFDKKEMECKAAQQELYKLQNINFEQTEEIDNLKLMISKYTSSSKLTGSNSRIATNIDSEEDHPK